MFCILVDFKQLKFVQFRKVKIYMETNLIPSNSFSKMWTAPSFCISLSFILTRQPFLNENRGWPVKRCHQGQENQTEILAPNFNLQVKFGVLSTCFFTEWIFFRREKFPLRFFFKILRMSEHETIKVWIKTEQ